MEILQVTIHARDSKRNELWRTCQAISEAVRQETGCMGSKLFTAKDNGNLIYLEETWESRADMEEHFRSDMFSALLGAMKLLGESSEIRINEGSAMEGMDAVKAARAKERPSAISGR